MTSVVFSRGCRCKIDDLERALGARACTRCGRSGRKVSIRGCIFFSDHASSRLTLGISGMASAVARSQVGRGGEAVNLCRATVISLRAVSRHAADYTALRVSWLRCPGTRFQQTRRTALDVGWQCANAALCFAPSRFRAFTCDDVIALISPQVQSWVHANLIL